MANVTWYKFSPGAWSMGKIQKVSETTQLRFIKLCNLYWMKQCCLTVEDAEIEIDKKHLNALIQKRIVKSEGSNIVIQFLDEQRNDVEKTIEGRKKAANTRWGKNADELQNDASAMQMHANAMQNDADKIDKIDKKYISEIEISDVELGLVEYLKIAKSFQNLFIKNLKEKHASTAHQEIATFKSYVDPIRLMIKNKEATIEDLQDVWDYLDSPQGEFWKVNILSTSKLREKITTLVMSARQNKPKEKQDRL